MYLATALRCPTVPLCATSAASAWKEKHEESSGRARLCKHARGVADKHLVQRQKVHHHGKQEEEEELDEDEEEEEHIDCTCGVTGDTPGAHQYDGLWLQCDECLSWLHGACVGYPRRAPKGQNAGP